MIRVKLSTSGTLDLEAMTCVESSRYCIQYCISYCIPYCIQYCIHYCIQYCIQYCTQSPQWTFSTVDVIGWFEIKHGNLTFSLWTYSSIFLFTITFHIFHCWCYTEVSKHFQLMLNVWSLHIFSNIDVIHWQANTFNWWKMFDVCTYFPPMILYIDRQSYIFNLMEIDVVCTIYNVLCLFTIISIFANLIFHIFHCWCYRGKHTFNWWSEMYFPIDAMTGNHTFWPDM